MTAILNMLAGSGGALTTALSTTLTIGTATAGAGLNLRGFTSTAILGYTPTTFGSLASAAVTGGRTCISVYDSRDTGSPEYSAVLRISGFSTDPSRGYLYDVTANSTTKTEATVSTYTYISGTAIWEWTDTTTAVLFGFLTSGTTPLTIRIR
jgi:hypothetical protein